MKFTVSTIAAMASLSAASPVLFEKRAPALNVALAATGNTQVSVKVTNTGAEDLNLLSEGTMLDSAPTEKLKVYSAENSVEFAGIKKRIAVDNLNEEAFTFLAAGQSLEFSVDIAADHSLDAGGVYSVFAQGAIPYAAANTTTLVGAAQVESDTLDMEVDGVEASKVLKSIVDKRSAVQSDCTGSQRTATVNALANCATLARTAASNAQSSSGSNPFLTYFDTSSNSGTVTSCLNAIATECSSSTSGTTRTYCTDVYRACASNVLAYTVPSLSIIVNCPLYFSYLPALSRTCHAQDQATTTLHEVAHSNCGADDLAYGYSASVALSSSNSPRNADNYALYANALYVGC